MGQRTHPEPKPAEATGPGSMLSPLSGEARGAGHSPEGGLRYLPLCLPSSHPPGLWLSTGILIPRDPLLHIRTAVLAGTGAAAEIRTGLEDQVVFANKPAQLTKGCSRETSLFPCPIGQLSSVSCPCLSPRTPNDSDFPSAAATRHKPAVSHLRRPPLLPSLCPLLEATARCSERCLPSR